MADFERYDAQVVGISVDSIPSHVAFAKSLGGMLRDEFKVTRDIIAVDGIEVGDLDYIDIGECLGITEVIPVTVKSLMFPTTQSD